jgi:hypothetical protein
VLCPVPDIETSEEVHRHSSNTNSINYIAHILGFWNYKIILSTNVTI